MPKPEKPSQRICTGCGRVVTPGHYGENSEGIFCFDCCAKADLAYMAKHGKITLYLTVDNLPKNAYGLYSTSPSVRTVRVNNWPCSLQFRPSCISVGRHNMAGKRYDVWFRVENDPYVWHGVTYGDNTQICHCKRTKRTKF